MEAADLNGPEQSTRLARPSSRSTVLASQSTGLVTQSTGLGAVQRSTAFDELHNFIEALYRRVAALRSRAENVQQISGSMLADEVLSVVRLLVRRESGSIELSSGLPRFLSVLGASEAEMVLVNGLVEWAHSVLLDQRAGFSARRYTSTGAVLVDLQHLCDWFGRRSTTLALMSAEQEYLDEEGLFGAFARHDVQRSGARGVEVGAGVRLNGRRGVQLWLKLSARHAGKCIEARKEWRYWSDDASHLFDDSPGTMGALATLTPIVPVSDRCVIDEVVLFLPYGAFELSRSEADVEFELVLSDEHGKEVAALSLAERLCLGQRSQHGIPIPSPQSYGLWSKNSATGDEVRITGISQGLRGGWEHAIPSLNISCDVILPYRLDEQVRLECRFLDAAGEVVRTPSTHPGLKAGPSLLNANLLNPGASGAVTSGTVASGTGPVAKTIESSYYVQRIPLVSDTPFLTVRSLSFSVPMQLLDIPIGKQQLFVEIAVVMLSNEAICGTLERCSIEMPVLPRPVMALLPAPISNAQLGSVAVGDSAPLDQAPVTSLNVGSISIGSLDLIGNARWNGGPVLRVSARISVSTPSPSLYRVSASLLRANGKALERVFAFGSEDEFGAPLHRTVGVLLGGEVLGQEVVATFDAREVIGSLLTQDGVAASNDELPVRVLLSVRTLHDRELARAEGLVKVASNVLSGALSAPLASKNALFISDVLTRSTLRPGEAVCAVIVNGKCGAADASRFALYYELVNRDGVVVGFDSTTERADGLPGRVVECSLLRTDEQDQVFTRALTNGPFTDELIQTVIPVEVRHHLLHDETAPAVLRIMLFTQDGRCLQVVHHDLSSRDRSRLTKEMPVALPERSASPAAEVAPAKVGFFAWLWSLFF